MPPKGNLSVKLSPHDQDQHVITPRTPNFKTSFDDILLAVDHSPMTSPPSNQHTLAVPQRQSPVRHVVSTQSLRIPSTNVAPSLKPKKSFKTSLFNLFSPPNVERSAGYTEQGISPVALGRKPSNTIQHESLLRAGPPLRKQVSEAAIRDTGRTRKTPSPQLDLSRTRSKKDPSSLATSWKPPPLFQAYPQAILYATLEAPKTPDPEVDSQAKNSSKPLEGRRPSSSRLHRPRSSKNLLGGSGSSFDKFGPAEGSIDLSDRKIYILVTSGFLLQYAGSGSSTRLPERVLKLGPESCAFASDLIRGRHWVLQVQETAAYETGTVVAGAIQPSFFSKLSIRSIKRKSPKTMLLVFDAPENMKRWMISIRGEIERINGRAPLSPSSQKSPVDYEMPRSPLSHRFVMIPKQPADGEKSLSPTSAYPTSPTLVDAERMSGSTAFGTSSDLSSNRSSAQPRRLSDVQKLYVTTENSKPPEIPEMPGLEDDNPTPATAETASSYDSAMTSLDSIYSMTSQEDNEAGGSYVNAAHISLSRSPSMQTVTRSSSTDLMSPLGSNPGPAQNGNPRRLSSYNQGLHKINTTVNGSSVSSDSITPTSASASTLQRVPSITSAFPRPPSTIVSRVRTPVSPFSGKDADQTSYFRQRRPSVQDGSQSPPKPKIPAGPIIEDNVSPRTSMVTREQMYQRMQQKAALRASTSNPAIRQSSYQGLSHSVSSDNLGALSSRRPSASGFDQFRSNSYESSTLGTLPENRALRTPRNRTSLRSNTPLPLRSVSPLPPSQSRLEALSETSSANSSPRLSLRNSITPLPLPIAVSSPKAEYFPSNLQSELDTEPSSLRRPPSLLARSDQASPLSQNGSREPSPRSSVLVATNFSKRTSILVPVVRPPSVGPRARQGSRQSVLSVPPMQGPPPSRALPALPSQAMSPTSSPTVSPTAS